MSTRVVITEEHNRVIVEENVVRVIAVAVQGPPGPQGQQGDPGDADMTDVNNHMAATTDVHGIADTAQLATLSDLDNVDALPDADTGSLLVRGAEDWAPLSAGSEGEALVVASGVPAWGEVAGDGGSAEASVNPWPMRYYFNPWVLPGWKWASLSTSTTTAERIYLFPFVITRTRRFSAVGINVATAVPDAFYRLGIYNFDYTTGKQSTVRVDLGTVLADTTGDKILNVTPFDLTPGAYFTAYVSNANPAVRYINPTNIPLEQQGNAPATTARILTHYTSRVGSPDALPDLSGANLSIYDGGIAGAVWLHEELIEE